MQVRHYNILWWRGVMLSGSILAVASGKQAWGYGEVFWEEDLANFILPTDWWTQRPSDQSRRNNLPLGPIYFNLYNRTAEKSFTANDGSVGTPVIHNKNERRSLVNFLFRKGMCNLSNSNMGPCQPVFVSISHPNVPPLPSINRLTPYGSGFSTHVYPSLIQNCYAVALASASWSACCSFTNYLSIIALLIVQEGGILASQPFTGTAMDRNKLVGGCAQTIVSSGAWSARQPSWDWTAHCILWNGPDKSASARGAHISICDWKRPCARVRLRAWPAIQLILIDGWRICRIQKMGQQAMCRYPLPRLR